MSRTWMSLLVVCMLVVGCSGGADGDEDRPVVLTEANFSAAVREAILEAGTATLDVTGVGVAGAGRLRFGDREAVNYREISSVSDVHFAIVADDVFVSEDGVGFYTYAEDVNEQIRSTMPTERVMRFLPDDEEAVDAFRFVGEEEIDGFSFARYDLGLTADWIEEAFPDMPQGRAIIFWLDDSHRIRRILYNFADAPLRMDFTDWGEPVAFTAPTTTQMGYVPLTLETYVETVTAADSHVRSFGMRMENLDGTSMRGSFVLEHDQIAAMEMTYVEHGEEYEALCVDGECFARDESSTTYFRVDGPEADEILTEMEASLSQGMIAQTQAAEALLEEVIYRGLVETDGALLHRYEIVMDMATIAAAGGVDEVELPEVMIEVLLTADHQARRSTFQVDGQTMSMDLEPLDDSYQITPPPARLVEDLPAA